MSAESEDWWFRETHRLQSKWTSTRIKTEDAIKRLPPEAQYYRRMSRRLSELSDILYLYSIHRPTGPRDGESLPSQVEEAIK